MRRGHSIIMSLVGRPTQKIRGRVEHVLALLPVRETSSPHVQEEAKKDWRWSFNGFFQMELLPSEVREGIPLNTYNLFTLILHLFFYNTVHSHPSVPSLTYFEIYHEVGYKGVWKVRHRKVSELIQSHTPCCGQS